mgnify:CR=1 FL=1
MDVVGIGELLIDFTPMAEAEESYQALPGGAPANVVCAAQMHGLQTAFIGAVGEDHFGELLKETLSRRGVDVSGVL